MTKMRFTSQSVAVIACLLASASQNGVLGFSAGGIASQKACKCVIRYRFHHSQIECINCVEKTGSPKLVSCRPHFFREGILLKSLLGASRAAIR